MTKTILIIIGFLGLIGLLTLVVPSPTQSPTIDDESVVASSTTSGTTSTPVATTPRSSGTVKKPIVTSSNKVISPAAGARWSFGETHSIQWSEESLGNGAIYLVDATTKTVVGVVTPSLTLHQKTFTWNTRDVSVTRTGGQKKDVQPGQYFLRIVFEVGNKPIIESGIFSLIYASQQTTGVHTVIIKNYIATPLKVTVKRGDTIYIANNDTTSYTLAMSGFSPLVVPAGQTVKFETAALSVGSYEFYSSQYSALKLGITIQ